MTDTQHPAPTDAEIDAEWREAVAKHETTAVFVRDFARAVLAKWGAQPVPASAAEFALQALVAAGHVTQARVDQALALPGAPKAPAHSVEPVKLLNFAVLDDGELRLLSGQKAPPFDCELYAMPDGKKAPPLYTAPQPVVREPLTDEAARKLVFTASEWCRSEGISVEDAVEVVRATERAHGITTNGRKDAP